MHVANKIEFRPSAAQTSALSRACGVKRFVYNKCLAKIQADYQQGIKYRRKSLQKYVQDLRIEYPWIVDVSARCSYFAVDCLDAALKNFWAKRACFPKFKKKGYGDSFKLEHVSMYSVNGRKLKLQRVKTCIKMREKIRFEGRLMGVTIKPQAGKWFAVFLVEMETPPIPKPMPARKPIVGIDLGIKILAVLSNGQEFTAGRPLQRGLRKLKRRQRCLSRKQKGSHRRQKAKLSVSKLHYKIQCQRQAWLHQISDHVTKNFDHIVIEDLNVRGMLQNRSLAKHVSDAGWAELRRQIEYKSVWRGCKVTIADPWFASTKTCPGCGKLNDMPLKKRWYSCACGYSGDRDQTAALNLENYGRHRSVGDLKRAQESSKEGSDGANNKPQRDAAQLHENEGMAVFN